MHNRESGILLHITSLPSPFGIGDLGPSAYRFVDFLSRTKQHLWQILPLNPTDPGHGNSPYHSLSAFACSPLLLSPELLLRDGLLAQADLETPPEFPEEHVDYDAVVAYKETLFQRAFEEFKRQSGSPEFERFCLKNAHWLDDFALFEALKSRHDGRGWNEWPVAERDRDPHALEIAKKELSELIEKQKVLQYMFSKQWASLKAYCHEMGVKLIGDIPFYVIHDSADIWRHPEIVKLDSEKRPTAVAGVPPDYFSETGQLWGNPVYRWDVLQEKRYDWWVQRIRHNLLFFDYIRVDHFRGFEAYWEVPADEKTAINGTWVKAPGEDFFSVVLKEIPRASIIAEDLGTITPEVKQLMQRFELPGMKVLLFAFGGDLPTNPYVPHNHVENCIVYTGTHDNNTTRGWFEKELTTEDKNRLFAYLGREVGEDTVHWELIRLAMMSVAKKVIFPAQDVLGLAGYARMNQPATPKGNWEWRLLRDQLTPAVARKLLGMTDIYGRA